MYYTRYNEWWNKESDDKDEWMEDNANELKDNWTKDGLRK